MKYDIEKIKEMCIPYRYNARNSGYMCYINKSFSENEEENKENWWKPEIYCKLVSDEYDINEYTIERFAVCFSGYGTLELEEENKVINNLKFAKELVDKLNGYINECNKKFVEDK